MKRPRHIVRLAQILFDRKHRNKFLDLVKRRRHDSKVTEDNRASYERLSGRNIYFVGGCELRFIRETFDSIGCNTYLTFDHGRSADPLSEVTDDNSPIWDFRPDYILLSQVQLFRGSVEKLQTNGPDYSFDEQELDFNVLQQNYKHAIEKLRNRDLIAPVFLFNYPLTYRPAYGIHEYRSLRQGLSLVEFLLTYDLNLYQLARNHPCVYVLDINRALARTGKLEMTKEYNADGVYEHLERKASKDIALHLMYQLVTLDVEHPRVKCAVFDLDDTLWKGILREEGPEGVSVRKNYLMVMKLLQSRGIVLALCSKNDAVEEQYLPELLGKELYSRIVIKKLNWLPKSHNLRVIATELNIGIDTLAFFDDNPRERAEVRMNEPQVMAYSDHEILSCLNRVEFEPQGEISEVARTRTEKYLAELKRKSTEREFSSASYEDYLRSCELKIELRRSTAGELSRVHELLGRTNQLNATLRRTTLEDIRAYYSDPIGHGLWIACLEDRVGDFGLIGAIAVTKVPGCWEIAELAFSCRAMGKGVEHALLNYASRDAVANGVENLKLEFVPTERNGEMLKILREVGFDSINGKSPESSNHATEPLILTRVLRAADLRDPQWFDVV